MRASVIIRSKDEAYRLRLTLASLARQSVAAGAPPLHPAAARLTSLPQLAQAARARADVHGIEAARRFHTRMHEMADTV